METITYNDTPKALILDVILSFGFLKNNHYLCGTIFICFEWCNITLSF